MNENIELYLFDLGGVVIELEGTPLPNLEMNASAWLTSTTAKEFELGRISKHQFAEIFKKEYRIAETPNEIIEHFRNWPKGFYPGAIELLKELSLKYRVAALSNTNEIHWPRIIGEFGAYNVFEKIIASHTVGIAKPDPSIYLHALSELKVRPENTVFIDDNESNVIAAQKIGIKAYLAKGFSEVVSLISTLEQLSTQ
ncbi:HAD family hydrolase [Microbulbifer sp. SSSA002]|uniref:HAD family hydrolase n=1 Tax=Microbulbifer sp. SSSA002 TaxID=3243376 RepID=UPI004039C06C